MHNRQVLMLLQINSAARKSFYHKLIQAACNSNPKGPFRDSNACLADLFEKEVGIEWGRAKPEEIGSLPKFNG